MVMPNLTAGITPVHVGLEDVSVTLGGVQVLNNVTLHFNAPEITVILGPNGAGKSTFLSAISGLLPLTSGRQYRRDAHGADVPITRLGYVLQQPVIFRRSVLQNCHMAMQAAGLDPRNNITHRDDVLSLMAIDHLIHKSATQLSQGERQRLAVARVMLMRPGILMLDEATNSLDQFSIEILETQIRRYADAGLPVLWVTHSQEQAKRMADRIVIIDKGLVTSDQPAAKYFG